MPYVTSVKRIGREEGRLEGETSLLLRHLSRCYRSMDDLKNWLGQESF